MTPAKFNQLLQELDHLTEEQVQRLFVHFQTTDPEQKMIAALEQRIIDNPECPHCHSSIIKRNGKKGNMQRYLCKNCLRTFSATTHTPLARLRHKAKWLDYMEGMLASKVLRKAATDYNISLGTSFRWRHRFLQLPAEMKAQWLEGIVEADETFFAYSEKGNKRLMRKPHKRGKHMGKPGRSKEDWVPVLTVRDRGKHTFDSILDSTSIKGINEQITGKIEKDSVLCSDGYKSYIQVAQKNDLIHKRLNLSAGIRVIDKVFHIQNVNAYHSRLKNWINIFHGVATKYLDHYLGWFRLMDTSKNLNKNKLLFIQQHLRAT